jgi:VanZ family protein
VVAFLMFIDPEEKSIGFDKLLHYSFFSILSFFVYFTLCYQNKMWFLKKHRTVITLVTVLLLGASIEIIQLYIPGRSTNIFDMIANLFGALFTIFIIKRAPKGIRDLKKVGVS